MCLGPTNATARPSTTTSSSHAAARRSTTGSLRPVPMKRSRLSVSTASTTSTSWSSTAATTRDSVSISGRWVDDAAVQSCRKCERGFTLVNRRHHCRICGNIFCNACSRTRIVFSTGPGESAKRQRVCDPCASHAQSSAILYDIDDVSEPRESHFSTVSSTDFVTDSTDTNVVTVTSNDENAAPSVNFMVASMVCFATSFWFLKDEVSYSNPAIWILLAGFLKNLYELLVTVRLHRLQEAEKIRTEEQHNHFEVTHIHHTTTSSPESDVPPAKSDNLLSLTESKKADMLAVANKAVDTLWETAMSTDNWTPEPNSFPIDDVVLHSRDGKPVRIYKCEAVIDLAPDELFDLLHGQFETSSTWNVTAAENKVLQQLSDDTDIVHMTSAAALGGMVSSRDFVNTRTWRRKEGGYIIASTSAGKDLVKPAKGVTRGENGVTGFVILPHESSAFKSRFVWILNCDIKGYFPSSLIRKGSLSEMCCFIRNLRRHLAATIGSDSSAPADVSPASR
ncbi:hypothetical protein PINS_up001632 [Pythium insidiosum]|nr:hypothetical protein PINS_up001632 [Pythium insidiosum]